MCLPYALRFFCVSRQSGQHTKFLQTGQYVDEITTLESSNRRSWLSPHAFASCLKGIQDYMDPSLRFGISEKSQSELSGETEIIQRAPLPFAEYNGSSTLNVVPRFFVLLTLMRPWWSLTTDCAIASPSPVPCCLLV